MNSTRKRVYIVGAGGLGRELYSWLRSEPERYEVMGFLDDDPDKLDSYKLPVGIEGKVEGFEPDSDCGLLMAIMTPNIKQQVVEHLSEFKSHFIQYVHPTAIVGETVNLSTGCVIAPYCIATTNIRIGSFAFLNTRTTIGHDSRLDDFVSLNSNVDISGSVTLGKRVLIGSKAAIIPEVSVADDAVIGAGSIVVRNVAAQTTVFGNPAAVVSVRDR